MSTGADNSFQPGSSSAGSPSSTDLRLPRGCRLRYPARMKALLAVVVVMLALALPPAFAQGPDDQYIGIYTMIQQADGLATTGQTSAAIARYLEAQAALKKLQKAYPNWSPKVIDFRLNYIASKIAEATTRLPAVTAPGPVTVPKPAPAAAVPTLPAAPPPAAQLSPELQSQLQTLRAQVNQLLADNSLLEARLKEALAAHPAAVDPRELARAEDKIKSLLKDNDLLKVTLGQERARKPPAVSPAELNRLKEDLAAANRKLSQQAESAAVVAREKEALQQRVNALLAGSKAPADYERTQQALAEANRKLTEQVERANALAAEKATLQKELDALAAAPKLPADAEQTRKALAEVNRKLAAQSELARQLTVEKDALQSQARRLRTEADAAVALRTENELLKKQLADLKSPPTTPRADESNRALQQAQAQVAALQSDLEILRLEKTALVNRVKTLSSVPVTSTVLPSPTTAADAARLQQLERERADLQKRLDAATRELAGSKSRSAALRVREMTDQLSTLRARLQVFEARPVPYTAEELALMRKPEPRLVVADPRAGKKSIKELPPGGAALVAEAQRQFAARQFDKAEEKYLQLLRKDDRNTFTLANLAVIQMEMDRLEDAEKQVRRALAVTADDAYALLVLGQIKLRQDKHDEALDFLGRAAQLDPQSAEIQNFLGITLSHKGLRGPAETALRKAIQLEPAYAAAHNNLAVIYLAQNPPMTELGRWHYHKALAAGHPRNPELEKALDAKQPPAGQP